MEAIKKAITEAGGLGATAKILGISPQAVCKWRCVPDGRVLALSKAAGYKVTPHDLRPDLYPNASDGLPKANAA
jgi:DNA-binding transcriptional regulator YdaS (Cro superfamily)